MHLLHTQDPSSVGANLQTFFFFINKIQSSDQLVFKLIKICACPMREGLVHRITNWMVPIWPGFLQNTPVCDRHWKQEAMDLS